MSNKWDDMTRAAWDNSEVMQEFEKNLLKAIANFQKLAATPEQIQQVTPAVKELGPAADEAGEGMERLDKALSADDEFSEDMENSAEEIEESPDEELLASQGVYLEAADGLDFSETDTETAKGLLLDDLREMAREAALKGNIKLAYKIERAMDEIAEEL
jgi:uncharacterized phage infection (PIP) family protein YhgE